MIPFGNQTVTLLHRQNDAYKRYVLSGCSWHASAVRSMTGNTLESALETTCRIPADQQMPSPGDLLIMGNVRAAADSEIDLVRLMQSLRDGGKAVFRVQTVRDNSLSPIIPHFAATGA